MEDALQAVSEKHRHDIELINDEAATGDHLIEIETQKIQADVERIRRQLSKTDQIHNKRMTEANQAIDMLNHEIEASKERLKQMINDTEGSKTKYSQLQSELLKIEDQVQIVTSQLTDAEHQKSEMRAEITKLNRSIWNERRARLLHND